MEELIASLQSPIALALAVFFFSWLWEDGALIGSALLAADNQLPVAGALIAIYAGICSGDSALYGLGWAGRRWRGVRFWLLKKPGVRRYALSFKTKIWSNVFILRFVPGLRTLGFLSCGYWKIQPVYFLAAMALSGLIWVVIVFSVVYFLGASELLTDSPWKWSLFIIAVLFFFANNFVAKPFRGKKAVA